MDTVYLLSGVTTVLCMILKLPQIISVLKSGSIRGLSQSSLMLEFWSYATTASYSISMGYEWTMYSEYVPLLAQDLLIFLLIMRQDREDRESADLKTAHLMGNNNISINSKKSNKNLLGYQRSSLRSFIAVTIAVHSLIASRFLPKSIAMCAIAVSSPIGVVSKLLQLLQIIGNKSAGSVSGLTWFLNFLSTSARLVTVLMTHADQAIVLSLAASALLNFSVAAAVLWFPAKGPVPESASTAIEKRAEEKKEL